MRDHIKKFAAITSLLLVSACNSHNTLSLEPTGSVHSGNNVSHAGIVHPVSNHPALISFVGAQPQTLGVLQVLFKNGIKQRIGLPNHTSFPGENFIEVRIVEGRDKRGLKEKLQLHTNSERELFSAYSQQFPGRQFHVENQLLQNRYGHYGLAILSVSQTHGCMMAWQRVDTQPDEDTSYFARPGKINRENLSYQMRYCAPGLDASKARQIMQGVVIHGVQPGVYAPPVAGYGQHDPGYNPGVVYHQPSNLVTGNVAPTSLPQIQAPKPQIARAPVNPAKKRVTTKSKRTVKTVKSVERDYSNFPTVPLPE